MFHSRVSASVGSALFLAVFGVHAAEPDALAAAGRAIYLQGILASGQPLVGAREGSAVSGADAACVHCHQRSGMGIAEGRSQVPPVIGTALFDAYRRHGERRLRFPRDEAQRKPLAGERPPYDDESLARALREGLAPDGRPLHYLMPHYRLGDADLAALTAYLRSLTVGPSPGIEGGRIRLATVIAPGVAPQRRKILLDTLAAFIALRHPAPRGVAAAPAQVRPTWELDVWELEGPQDGWETQLRARYAERPVFALLSGLGGAEWAPVHSFCESNGIPCLLPNTEAPGGGDDFYGFYFSRGLVLEAEVLARHLIDNSDSAGIRRVVQASRPQRGVAARALRQALAGSAIAVVEREPPRDLPLAAASRAWLGELGPGDALALWLDEADLAKLLSAPDWPVPAPPIFLSTTLAAPQRLSAGGPWRSTVRFVHGLEAPGRLERRIALGLGPWLTRLGLPLVDPPLQAHTLAACVTLSEAMARLNGYWLRDYLVEAIESGMADHGAETVLLPRFAFGPRQRFASKGAYILRYADAHSPRVEVQNGFIVP